MNMTIVGNTQMHSKIKTPQELREECYARNEDKVNELLNHIRTNFSGVPCNIPLRWYNSIGGISYITKPSTEVFLIVKAKIENEILDAGWGYTEVILATCGPFFDRVSCIRIKDINHVF